MYECDCCERRNVPEKLKGIGYVCDDCLASYVWTGYESGPAPEKHYPVCPFRECKHGCVYGQCADVLCEHYDDR